MKHQPFETTGAPLLSRIADYAERYSDRLAPRDPKATADELRRYFDIGIPGEGRPADQVLHDLVQAAEPGLVGSTAEGFLSWVIGGSHPAGIAADWLTSLWGQNAALYQCSPAAAACEEVTGRWLVEILDLPAESAVGFVTGATMATFTCLAAARGELLRRVGYDIDRDGIQGSPHFNIIIGEDAHVTNLAALRYLGFGASNFVIIAADRNGLMRADALRAAADEMTGPTILIAQAGHINSGAFDNFLVVAEVAAKLGAWIHIDGAFGLWVRSAASLKGLTAGAELADSWAVDGHKWLQTPYDGGFAIVRNAAALRRVMAKEAGYLNDSPDDGRNPSAYVPELSRRARAFPVWTMLQVLGRNGIAKLVEQHCAAAARFSTACALIPGATILNDVVLNQIAVSFGSNTQDICDRVNADGRFFLRTADWRGKKILRVSLCGHASTQQTADELANAIAEAAASILSELTTRTPRRRHSQ